MREYEFTIDFSKYFKDKDFFEEIKKRGIDNFPYFDRDEIESVTNFDDIELAEFCYFLSHSMNNWLNQTRAFHLVKLFNFGWGATPKGWWEISVKFNYEHNIKGPVIGFLGNWLDLGTGNFMLGCSDKATGIVFYSFKDLFKDLGFIYDSNLVSFLIESYKTGTLDIFDVFAGMGSEEALSLTGSQVGRIFRKLKGAPTSSETMRNPTNIPGKFNKESMEIFNGVINALIVFRKEVRFPVGGHGRGLFSSCQGMHASKEGFSPTRQIFQDYPGFKILVNILSEEAVFGQTFSPIISKIRTSTSSQSFSNSCMQLSAMSPKIASYDNYGVALIMNILDVMEVSNKDSEMIECFDHPESVKDFLKGSALKDYLKGARLSSITRSLKSNLPTLNRAVSNTADLLTTMEKEVSIQKEPHQYYPAGTKIRVKAEVLIDNKKIFKLMGKALDRVENMVG